MSWGTVAQVGGNALAGMYGGGGGQGRESRVFSAGPWGQYLYDRMATNYLAGRGDYGTGAAVKQGNANLQQLLAERGIRPDSGVGSSALADMIAKATALGAENKRKAGLDLINSRFQTATGHTNNIYGTAFNADGSYRNTAGAPVARPKLNSFSGGSGRWEDLGE